MCRVDWSMIQQFIVALNTWPLMILLVVIIFTCKFKKEIADLIDRISEASAGGATIKAPPSIPQQAIKESDTTSILNTVKDTTIEATATITTTASASLDTHSPYPQNVIDEVALLEADAEIFLSVPENQYAVNLAREHPIAIVKEYRKVGFHLFCERTLTAIFGTQLELLERMLTTGQYLSYSDMAYYHATHQKLMNRYDFSLELYIQFLINSELVKKIGNESYELTNTGIDFINYLKMQYKENWKMKAF